MPNNKLKYADIMDIQKTARTFFTVVLGCLLLITACEILAYYFDLRNGVITGEFSDIVSYILLPSAIFLAVYLLMVASWRFFHGRGKTMWQAFSVISAISVICSALVYLHYLDSAIYVLFGFPMLAALQFIDIRPVTLAFLLNLATYLAFTFWLLPARHADYHQGYLEIISYITYICGIYIGCLPLLHNLSALVDNIVRKNDQVRRDSLTGLLNHSAFYESLDEMILANHNQGAVFSLILWDIDNFKSVNDTFGHDNGDCVLAAFVQALNEKLSDGDLAFRYGGEEFAVLTPVSDRLAYDLSEHVRARFTELGNELGLGVPLSASAGVCQYDRKLFGGNREFFSSADNALYVAKRALGKDNGVIWYEGINDRMLSPVAGSLVGEE